MGKSCSRQAMPQVPKPRSVLNCRQGGSKFDNFNAITYGVIAAPGDSANGRVVRVEAVDKQCHYRVVFEPISFRQLSRAEYDSMLNQNNFCKRVENVYQRLIVPMQNVRPLKKVIKNITIVTDPENGTREIIITVLTSFGSLSRTDMSNNRMPELQNMTLLELFNSKDPLVKQAVKIYMSNLTDAEHEMIMRELVKAGTVRTQNSVTTRGSTPSRGPARIRRTPAQPVPRDEFGMGLLPAETSGTTTRDNELRRQGPRPLPTRRTTPSRTSQGRQQRDEFGEENEFGVNATIGEEFSHVLDLTKEEYVQERLATSICHLSGVTSPAAVASHRIALLNAMQDPNPETQTAVSVFYNTLNKEDDLIMED